MKRIIMIISFMSLGYCVSAQDFAFGKVTAEELSMKNYSKDTSAHALVLNEHGKSAIMRVGDDDIELVYLYHTKIKIFDKQGFDQANFKIEVYSGNGEDYEKAEDIKGITYNFDNTGNIQTTQLEAKKIFSVKENKHWTSLKFAMPAVQSGCIIEITYRIVSPYIYNFHSWDFQTGIPKLHSEYEASIPAFWTYNASLRGSLKLTTNIGDVQSACFEYRGAKADCSHLVFGMTNVPAFIEEEDMTSARNFLSAVYFELAEETDMATGAKKRITKEWKDVDYQLKTSTDFGGQLKRKDLMKDRIVSVVQGKTDDLEKAKAVYYYLQKWYKWNNFIGIYSIDGIRKAFDTHSGSVADINLSLVTSLNSAGLNAEAVLLSTRENGLINKLYPGVGDFNYVIAKVNIGDKSYLLDATDQLMPFGMLPLKCLNDQGRVMSLDKPSYWIDLITAQRKSNTYSLDFTLLDNGKIKGTLIHYSTGYEAYLKRKAIKKFNTTDEYVESLNEGSHKLKFLKANITGIDSLEQPLAETYEVELNAYKTSAMDDSRISFNPFILDMITTNPYRLADRSYPVDWGMPSESRYVLTMHLPPHYTVENPPKNLAFAMPDKGGRFVTSYEGDDNTFTFSHIKQFNKSVYSIDEYPYLRELYNKIIQSEKENLIFKKNL